MAARFGLGLLKGLLVGAAIGAGIYFGLHWATPSGQPLAYLLAIGATGTTGIFAGRAPWKEGAWIEAALKGTVGAVVGGGLYWAASHYAGAVPHVPVVDLAWTALPPLYLAIVAAVFGGFVELDHTGDVPAPAKKSAAPPPPPPRRPSTGTSSSTRRDPS